jgi:hypothetical protein
MSTKALQSPQLQRAARRELDRLAAQQHQIEQRLVGLENEREKLRDELRALGGQSALLEEVLGGGRTVGSAEQSPGVVLRGARLREEATRVLYERAGPNAPVHYAKWHDWMVEEGFVVLGKRPKSTFLTGVSRSPLVVRGDEPGTYLIDTAVLGEIERELGEKRAELADVDGVLARETGPAPATQRHRLGLLATIRRLDKQLAEGRRVIAAGRESRSNIRAA